VLFGPYLILFILGLIPTLFLGSMVSDPMPALVLMIISGIASVLISFFIQVALLYAVVDREHISAGEIYKIALARMFSYSWVVFFVGLVTFGGSFFLIAPGVIFSIWFSFSVFVFAEEDKRGMNALLKSKEYTKGLWGSILWRYIAFALVIIGPLFIFFAIFGIIMAVTSAMMGSTGQIAYQFISSGFQIAIQILMAPFVLTYSYMLFMNVKELKGNQVAEDPQGKKWPYIIIGVVGTIIGIALMVALPVLLIF